VGAAAIFARFALSGAQPLAVSALRLLIASAILFGFGFAQRATPGRKLSRTEQLGLFLGGLLLAAHFTGWIWSLKYTTVAVSTLLVTTTPLWTTLYDATVLKRRFGAPVWVAYATAAAGLILVVGVRASPPPVPGHQWLGIGLALFGSVAIGAYFTLIRNVRGDLGTRRIVTATYGWAALILAIAALAARQPPPPAGASVAWFGVVAMALVSQLLGHTALNASLRWFSPNAIAMTTLLEPVFAAILAAAIFRERLSLAAVAGGALLLASIGVVLQQELNGGTPRAGGSTAA